MQLKRRYCISKALAAATCSLLSSPGHSQPVSDEPQWDTDFSSLYYSERDRITVSENAASARRQTVEEEFITARVVTDSMTGASPNGAVPASEAQTFTAPSGDIYTVPAGAVPLADFKDTRIGLDVEWEKPLDPLTRANYGASLSIEKDYNSAGASATFRRDINQRMTTLTTGISGNFDRIDSVGGIPYALRDTGSAERYGSDSKATLNFLGGVTQIINRSTIAQFNYTITDSSGYLTDPYKIVSIVEGFVDADGNHRNSSYIFESRPAARLLQSLYMKLLHQFGDDVLTFSYRYYRDDWGILSRTVDVRYRYKAGEGYYIQPHVRYYTQTAADFYRSSLPETEAIPEFISADYRLGKLDSTTVGLKFGGSLRENLEFSVRGEYLRQEDRDGEFQSLDAVILQGSLSYLF